jgi:hypothetical protein
LVCFGKRTWIKIKEVLKETALLEKQSGKKHRKEVNSGNRAKATEIPQSKKNRNGYFSLDGSGIRTRLWWEKENWAMVTDPENPFRDLTREEESRITELVKGMGGIVAEASENATSAKFEVVLK